MGGVEDQDGTDVGDAGPKCIQSLFPACQAQHSPQDPDVGEPDGQQIQPHGEGSHDVATDVIESSISTGQLHHHCVFTVAVGDGMSEAVRQVVEEKRRGNMIPAALTRASSLIRQRLSVMSLVLNQKQLRILSTVVRNNTKLMKANMEKR